MKKITVILDKLKFPGLRSQVERPEKVSPEYKPTDTKFPLESQASKMKKLHKEGLKRFSRNITVPVILAITAMSVLGFIQLNNTKASLQNFNINLLDQISKHKNQIAICNEEMVLCREEITKADIELSDLKNQDQYKINKQLEEDLDNIHKTYLGAVSTYEELVKLKESVKEVKNLDKLYTQSLILLTKKNYTSASAVLLELDQKIKTEQAKAAASFSIPANIPQSNTPPNSGYNRQQVTTSGSSFMVNIISADLSSTKVIVDTSYENDCSNDCPTTTLADFVSRNGAYAGVTGAYYCPAEYPSCSGKTNTFDLLIMNKNKHYFNSDNNVYSTNPAVIFGNGWIRFVEQGSQWGRDTGVDGVLMNFPLLVYNSESRFGGNSDTKMTSKSTRGFVANKGNTVYIGYVHNATVAESADVLKTLGMENLDGGGTVAMWANGGYKVGPGRQLTNAILFVRK